MFVVYFKDIKDIDFLFKRCKSYSFDFWIEHHHYQSIYYLNMRYIFWCTEEIKLQWPRKPPAGKTLILMAASSPLLKIICFDPSRKKLISQVISCFKYHYLFHYMYITDANPRKSSQKTRCRIGHLSRQQHICNNTENPIANTMQIHL